MYTQCAQMTFWGKFILQSRKIQVDFKLKKKTRKEKKNQILIGVANGRKNILDWEKTRKFEKI